MQPLRMRPFIKGHLPLIHSNSGRRDVDLLGFFWVENEKREPRLVMVTPLGLELYDLQVHPRFWEDSSVCMARENN